MIGRFYLLAHNRGTQGIYRVHRLGQNKEVDVRRLVIADTVEDRVLQMQERKVCLVLRGLGPISDLFP
jgi:hypothetical protein